MSKLLNNIYVVNLDRSKDRLAKIDMNLKKYGLKYERFPAVDGKSLTEDEINKSITSLCQYVLCNKSQVGCALSHIKLWKMISTSSEKWHLILEDDLELNDKTINFINKLEKSPLVNSNNTIISLWCTGPFCTDSFLHSNSIKDEQQLITKPFFPLGTVAYLITNDAAGKLYDYFEKNKINYHVDYQLAYNLKDIGIEYYTVKEAIIQLDNSAESTITTSSSSITAKILNAIGLSKVSWYLSIPIMTFNLKYTISGFVLIFILLLLLNVFIFHNKLIYIYTILELLIAFF